MTTINTRTNQGINDNIPRVSELGAAGQDELSSWNIWANMEFWGYRQAEIFEIALEEKFSTEEKENQYRDAFRHAYVSAAFAKNYSSSAAWILGIMNEINFQLFTLYDPLMDLSNNSVGRSLADKYADDEVGFALAFWLAVMDGEILTIHTDQNGDRSFERSSVEDLLSFDGDKLNPDFIEDRMPLIDDDDSYQA